ncbi:MAG: hypothetical protein PHR35_04290, partial [Kiritimatiellae bacterium]|nr:hypothetical protein [Kiritimatiellia bacterium]
MSSSVRFSSVLFALVAGLWSGVLRAAVLFEEDVTFQASFDGVLESVRGSNRSPVASGPVEFVPGRIGQAVVIGEGTNRFVAYSSEGTINPVEGTCLFWCNLLDWRPRSPSPTQIYFFSGEEPRMSTYVAFGQDCWDTAFALCSRTGGAVTRSGVWEDAFVRAWMATGEWHQVGFAWRGGEVRQFLDGAEISRARDGATPPYAFGPRWMLGNASGYQFGSWGKGVGQGRTAIDDVAIYRRALENAEVRELYRQSKSTNADSNASAVLLVVDQYVISQRLRVRVMARAMPDYARQAQTLRFALETADHRVALDVAGLAFTNGMMESWVSTRGVTAGAYRAVAEVRNATNGCVASADQTLTLHPRPAWADNTIGKANIVPWPFTPLAYSNSAVHCWGREYRYGPSLLPAQIVAAGIPLIREPVELRMRQGRRWTSWVSQAE